jgi:hypothetical protein
VKPSTYGQETGLTVVDSEAGAATRSRSTGRFYMSGAQIARRESMNEDVYRINQYKERSS